MIPIGAGIYDYYRSRALPNNAIILGNAYFTCLSGSNESNVGQFIGRDNTPMTTDNSNYYGFDIWTGESDSLTLFGHILYGFNQGIYTCRIPDESGKIVDVNVGLFSYYCEFF